MTVQSTKYKLQYMQTEEHIELWVETVIIVIIVINVVIIIVLCAYAAGSWYICYYRIHSLSASHLRCLFFTMPKIFPLFHHA